MTRRSTRNGVLSSGANGYIMKQAASEQFLVALRKVLDGGVYVSDAVNKILVDRFTAGGHYVSAQSHRSAEQSRAADPALIGKGTSTREIAVALDLSVKTVESHRQRIKKKLPDQGRLATDPLRRELVCGPRDGLSRAPAGRAQTGRFPHPGRPIHTRARRVGR